MAAYAGLYVYDVYDAVQGGDETLPSLPFNLSGGTIVYESTTYSKCNFGWFGGASGKVLRYALTRKNDGMTLTGLTKLSTMGSYGDNVGLAINGDTPSSRNIGPGNVYAEFATTDLTEIAIKLSGYVDPIAFWLPGATLVPISEPETRCVLYKHTGFRHIVDVINPSTTPSGPYGTYGTGTLTGKTSSVSTLSKGWLTAVRFGQNQVMNLHSSSVPAARSGGNTDDGGWTSRQDLVFVPGVDANGNSGGQVYKKDSNGNLTEPSGPFIPSPVGPGIG
jgi:hypothetical protein